LHAPLLLPGTSLIPVMGTDLVEKSTGWFFDFSEQWSSLIGRCNWYDFTLIHIGGEFAPYTDRWEFDLGLLGFTARVTYVYSARFNEQMKLTKNRVVAELEGRTGLKVEDPLGVLERIGDDSK